ncbi:MAG: hypothetical protein UMR38_05615 [Candidatus Izemoplasma sp.]|nr:hypothetical protein [Candidatus Izemoplasma sp.]
MSKLENNFNALKKMVRRPIQITLVFILVCTSGIIIFFQTGAEIFFAVMIVILAINLIPKMREHRKILHIEQSYLQHPKDAIGSISDMVNKLTKEYKSTQHGSEEGGVDHSKLRRLKKKITLLEEIKSHIKRQS